MDKPNIRDSIVIFAEAMDRKLRREDATKQAWETEPMFILRDKVDEEDELDAAFEAYQSTSVDPDGKALMEECCDVALYSMMIFSQIHPLTRKNRRGHKV